MADFDRIRDYVKVHRDDLAGEVAAGMSYELDSLERQWAQEGDQARSLELGREVLGRYPEVRQALEDEGLWPAEWNAEPVPAPVPPRAQVLATAAMPPPASKPAVKKEADKPSVAPAAADRGWQWDKGLAVGKEVVTGCLGVLIVIVTLGVAVVTLSVAGTDGTWEHAKDVLLILNGLVGVVLGYYFGRIPAEVQANKAETAAAGARSEARAAESELDQTKAEVRGMLSEAKVATSRGTADEEMELSAEQARRLWELVNR
jgi:hypothetical protein